MFWVIEFTYAEYILEGLRCCHGKQSLKKISKKCTDFSYVQFSYMCGQLNDDKLRSAC